MNILNRYRNLTKRDFLLFIYKRFPFIGLNRKRSPNDYSSNSLINKVNSDLKYKNAIIVVLSGPSSKNFVANKDHYFFTTNNSNILIPKKVKNRGLYFLYDPFFAYRYLKFNKFISKNEVVFFYPCTKFDKIRKWNEMLIIDIQNVLNKSISSLANNEYLFDKNSQELQEIEAFFYKELSWDGEFYNSGLILLMLATYFSIKNDLDVHLYGLDMGIGGLVHIDDEKSIFNPKFLSEKNLEGVAKMLIKIETVLGERFINNSFFKG